jgi:hypothetical protein
VTLETFLQDLAIVLSLVATTTALIDLQLRRSVQGSVRYRASSSLIRAYEVHLFAHLGNLVADAGMASTRLIFCKAWMAGNAVNLANYQSELEQNMCILKSCA